MNKPNSYDVEVFYDGDCPLCMREINMLRKWDKRERIQFTDIAADDFSASGLGVDQQQLMARIHGRLPDGTMIEGVEVFRRLYAAVGWTWPVALTRLPLVKQGLDAAYTLFARNRLWLTRRRDESCDRCATG